MLICACEFHFVDKFKKFRFSETAVCAYCVLLNISYKKKLFKDL